MRPGENASRRRVGGFEFLEAFAELARERPVETAFIMFTSSALAQDRERAMAFDCVRKYLLKEELSPDTMASAVEVALGA